MKIVRCGTEAAWPSGVTRRAHLCAFVSFISLFSGPCEYARSAKLHAEDALEVRECTVAFLNGESVLLGERANEVAIEKPKPRDW